ncbi:hypothetical protein K501DRAFT_176641 [Backusella circina FSU 941]|nr:hypothetical protein K501DRAFT_176641 [Backusella circina FSU 941]
MNQHFEAPVRYGSDTCMTLNEFKEKYARHFINQLEMTETDVMWLLKYLQSQHGVAIANDVRGYATTYMLIKLPQRNTETAIITKHDEAVLSIRTTSHALSVQVDELQKKSEELEQQSREEKSKGRIPKALYCLKKKRTLQDILQKRLHSMETMDTILMKMEASQDDKQVVEAFNLGADALRNLLGGEGLSLESVDDAMQNIQNALRDQKEVEDAIKMGNDDIANLSGYSDTDLEQELSQLMEEDAQTISKPPPTTIRPPPLPANSELARLNQMFSNIKSIPTDINPRSERVKELA